ncbi:hypothetical protein D046_9184, partial [Vibrio parahaemolyticus V-223/04]
MGYELLCELFNTLLSAKNKKPSLSWVLSMNEWSIISVLLYPKHHSMRCPSRSLRFLFAF